MGFFKDVDETKLIERHIRRIVGLENVEARLLMNHYKDARKRIMSDLLASRADSFTEEKLNILLAQIDNGIRFLNIQLKNQTRDGFDFAYEQGVEDSTSEVNLFNKKFSSADEMTIPVDIILLSTNRRIILLNQYMSSIESYNESLRNKIQRELTQGLIAKTPYSTLVGNISNHMVDDEWKIHRIARTELHNIYNISKMDGLTKIKENYLPNLQKTLIHPMDARTGQDSIELAEQNPIVDIDKPFIQKYNSKVYRFMAPPNRPNDRAILVPYRAVWE